MTRQILAMAVFLILAAGAAAGTLTEEQAVNSAVNNNPEVLSAQKLAGAYEARAHKDFFPKNPMVGLDVMGIKAGTVDLDQAMQKYLMVTQTVPFPLKYIWKAGASSATAVEHSPC